MQEQKQKHILNYFSSFGRTFMNTRWLRHAALAALLGASAVSYVCTPAEAADPTVPVRVVTQVKGGVLEISVTWANEASPIFKSEYSSGAARITIDGASLKGSTQVIPLEGNNAKEALISQVDDETVVVNIRAENEPHIKVFQIPTVKNVKGVKYVLPINLLSTKPAVAPKADNKKPTVAPKADDKKPAVAPKADDKKPAAAPKADDKKPATAPKADDKKPAVAPKADDKKPTVAPKTDDKKPTVAPKADDKKPAVAPKADDKKPAVAPKADDKKPAAAPKADDKKPAVAPKADDKKPAVAPKADDKKPAAAPKADDKKPAVAPKADDKKPAAAPKADDKKPAIKKTENVRKTETKPVPPQLTAKDDPVKVKVIFNPKADELRIGLIYKGNLKNVVKRAKGSDSTMSIELCPATLQGPTQSAKLERGQVLSYQAKQAAANKVIIEVKVQNPPYFVQDVDVQGGAFYGISYNYAQDYKPAVAPQADNKKPAVAPKAEGKKPAAAPKADDKKPAVAPKAEDKKPAVAPKADDKKPAVAPKADDKKPAVAPKADDKKPAVAPKADDKKPAVAPKADDKKPTVAPKADDKKPAVAPKAEDKKPAVAPKAEDKKPAAIPIETSVTKENATVVKDHYAYFPLKERSAATVAASLIKLYPNVDFKVDEMLNVIFVQGSAEDVAKIGNVLKVVSNFEK